MPNDDLLLVVDTETTGLPNDRDARVIELGAVLIRLDDGAEAKTFHSFVRPDVWSPRAAGALRINGLTRDEVYAHGLPQTEAASAWEDWWRHYLGAPPVHAWNAPFDREMMRRMGWDPEPTAWGPCLLGQATKRFGYRMRLEAAVEKLGLRLDPQPHRALGDARIAARVGREMRNQNTEMFHVRSRTIPSR